MLKTKSKTRIKPLKGLGKKSLGTASASVETTSQRNRKSKQPPKFGRNSARSGLKFGHANQPRTPVPSSSPKNGTDDTLTSLLQNTSGTTEIASLLQDAPESPPHPKFGKSASFSNLPSTPLTNPSEEKALDFGFGGKRKSSGLHSKLSGLPLQPSTVRNKAPLAHKLAGAQRPIHKLAESRPRKRSAPPALNAAKKKFNPSRTRKSFTKPGRFPGAAKPGFIAPAARPRKEGSRPIRMRKQMTGEQKMLVAANQEKAKLKRKIKALERTLQEEMCKNRKFQHLEHLSQSHQSKGIEDERKRRIDVERENAKLKQNEATLKNECCKLQVDNSQLRRRLSAGLNEVQKKDMRSRDRLEGSLHHRPDLLANSSSVISTLMECSKDMVQLSRELGEHALGEELGTIMCNSSSACVTNLIELAIKIFQQNEEVGLPALLCACNILVLMMTSVCPERTMECILPPKEEGPKVSTLQDRQALFLSHSFRNKECSEKECNLPSNEEGTKVATLQHRPTLFLSHNSQAGKFICRKPGSKRKKPLQVSQDVDSKLGDLFLQELFQLVNSLTSVPANGVLAEIQVQLVYLVKLLLQHKSASPSVERACWRKVLAVTLLAQRRGGAFKEHVIAILEELSQKDNTQARALTTIDKEGENLSSIDILFSYVFNDAESLETRLKCLRILQKLSGDCPDVVLLRAAPPEKAVKLCIQVRGERNEYLVLDKISGLVTSFELHSIAHQIFAHELLVWGLDLLPHCSEENSKENFVRLSEQFISRRIWENYAGSGSEIRNTVLVELLED